MGLYASFSPEDLGYQFSVSSGDVEVEVDYSWALEEAVATFIQVATDLVPVRTGYLCSTIDAETDGYEFAEFYADAEYAQYVEYGTWCCPEQPYFRPALEEALDVFKNLAQEAYNEAQQELQDMLSKAMEASMASAGGGSGGFLGGLATFALSFVVLFPVLVNVYGIMDTVFGSASSGGSVSADDLIEIT